MTAEVAQGYLLARGIDREAALFAQLGVVGEPLPGHDQFKGMLSVPYVAPGGVVGIKFRCPSFHDCKAEGHPKYSQPPGQHQRLYNVRALHAPEPYIAICEGELDALVMHQRVGIPAVGAPGTGAWLEHFPRVFADYSTVLVLADHDVKPDGSSPGLRHAEKVAKSIGQSAVVIRPPEGLDLTDWFLTEGADKIREACGVATQ